jgi:hypothetical protein
MNPYFNHLPIICIIHQTFALKKGRNMNRKSVNMTGYERRLFEH